ncbi:hypothetical protein MMC19_005204 [Ptychographa xylographoides]|nr:hypothetical protein [Ptychographa xylographoides]
MTSNVTFEHAAAEAKKLNDPSLMEQLEVKIILLYKLFKVATNCGDPGKLARPSAFNPKEKAKYDAWKALHDSGMKAPEAQQKYIRYEMEMKAKYGLKNKN